MCLGGGIKQVCGFDLLRSHGRSYVCDVNGWSFVKNSYKYEDQKPSITHKLSRVVEKNRYAHVLYVLPGFIYPQPQPPKKKARIQHLFQHRRSGTSDCCTHSLSQFKNSRYYDDAASVLRLMLLKAKAPHLILTRPPPSLLQSNSQLPKKIGDDGALKQAQPTSNGGTFGKSEELRCVIAVLRQ